MLLICITIAVFIFIIGYVAISTFDDGDLTAIYLCIIALVGVILASLFGSYKANEMSCEKKATAQGLEYKYGWWEGCLVKESDGNYIDYDRYIVVK